MQITNDEADIANENGAFLPPSGELGPDSITNDSNEDAEDTRDDSIIFEREVEATFQRAVEEDVTEDHVILEVNSLRLSYNMTSADCAGALFYSVMKLALDAPHDSPNELCKNVVSTVKKWKKLLMYYLSSIDEEIEVILKFEEMCLESTKEYCPLFERILDHLYDQDIIQEEAVLEWASEKEGAEEPDKIFVKQSENFIQDMYLLHCVRMYMEHQLIAMTGQYRRKSNFTESQGNRIPKRGDECPSKPNLSAKKLVSHCSSHVTSATFIC